MNNKRRPVETDSGYEGFRRIKSPYVDLGSNQRFAHIVLGGFGFMISSIGLVASCIRMTNVTSGSAAGAYVAGSFLGFLFAIVVLGALWYASLSMIFRSQKLRGYNGFDTSSDLVIFALVVLLVGLLGGLFSGISAVLGDALDRNASRAVPIALFCFFLIPIFSSGLFLWYRHTRMYARLDDRRQVADDENLESDE